MILSKTMPHQMVQLKHLDRDCELGSTKIRKGVHTEDIPGEPKRILLGDNDEN